MGKKLGQASSKVSKNNEKKQLNNWIKVLRPKVYITDSSSFKRLVQELTGNGTTAISTIETVAYKSTSSSTTIQKEPESSLETTSPDSSLESNHNQVSFPHQEEHNQSYNKLIYLDDTTPLDDLLWMNQEGDRLLQCQDLESLLPDIDRFPLYERCSQILQEEVSIYDYELSAIL